MSVHPSRRLSTNLLSKTLAIAAWLTAVIVLAIGALASGPAENVLYSFQGGSNDGAAPYAGPVADNAGNLYGTTFFGGPGLFGVGIVFELSPPARKGEAWTETILLYFNNTDAYAGPWSPVVRDADGNLYGNTWFGGECGGGLIFELSPPAQQGGTWTETELGSLGCYDSDVYSPQAGLTLDQAGNIYGTASTGGTHCPDIGGCGGVFEFAKPTQPGGAWTESVIYNFPGSDNVENGGGGTMGGLAIDSAGALYGTTVY